MKQGESCRPFQLYESLAKATLVGLRIISSTNFYWEAYSLHSPARRIDLIGPYQYKRWMRGKRSLLNPLRRNKNLIMELPLCARWGRPAATDRDYQQAPLMDGALRQPFAPDVVIKICRAPGLQWRIIVHSLGRLFP